MRAINDWSRPSYLIQWANVCWDATEMTWKNPRTTRWMNHWVMNQWTRAPLTQCANESMIQWSFEARTQLVSQILKQWISLLSSFFTERPHGWGTELLRFSEQPLIWATCALGCLPARSCGFCNPCKPSLRAAVTPAAILLATGVAASLMLCCMASRWNPAVASPVPFTNLIFQKCFGAVSLRARGSARGKPSSRQSCALLSTTFADRSPEPRKQRPYFDDHGSNFTRRKTA